MARLEANATEKLPGDDVLPMLDLFAGLPPEALSVLKTKSLARTFRKGHVFFRSGDSGHRLFILEHGRVLTFRMFEGRKFIIADLRAPAVFGEMGCVGQCVCHCSAQATEPSRVRMIDRNDLEISMEQYPVLTRRLLDLVSERFVRVLLDLEATSFRKLIPRIATLLLSRAQDECVENLTHQEIAQLLRVYRESVSSALGELRKAEIVSVYRKRIRILDRARLERAARE